MSSTQNRPLPVKYKVSSIDETFKPRIPEFEAYPLEQLVKPDYLYYRTGIQVKICAKR